MKRLNNKGFAITTIVYGLSILGIMLMAMLMGVMSMNRANTKEMSNTIEDDLNRFSKTEVTFDASIPGGQAYEVPQGESGWYKIELWGAQGDGGSGGPGAYTSGVIELKAGDILYFFVGSMEGGRGGKETDVRVINGSYEGKGSYETRIMVAAGGGVSPGAAGGTLYGYNDSMISLGGIIDQNTFNIISTDGTNTTNGTLAGYTPSFTLSDINYNTITTSSTVKSPAGTSGGGDGYIPGNASTVGGASFISGYGGCKAVVKGSWTTQPTYTYYASNYNEETDEYGYEANPRTYKFVDGMMIAGINIGDGKAKIERMVEKTEDSQTLKIQNEKLKTKYRYIRDCLGNTNTSPTWKNNFSVMSNGVDVAAGKSLATTSVRNQTCRVVDLGAQYQIDEITIWHSPGVDYKNHTIEVSTDNSSWVFLKNSNGDNSLSETESVTGIRISAYQYDATGELPQSGTYYLMPVLSDKKVITAREKTEEVFNAINIENLKGYKRQKWSIELINNTNISPEGSKEYKIVEISRYKALAILLDENIVLNTVAAATQFNNYTRNEPQIWKIIPMGDGTYTIKTVVSAFQVGTPSGNILPQTNSKADHYGEIVIGKENIQTERFKLISVAYS